MAVEPDVEENTVNKLPVQRLCNEIQLFDLCDREKCSFKKERFCTNADLLTSFERIAEAEVRRPVSMDEESEEGEDAGDEEYDDEFEDDGYGDKAEYDDK